MASRRRARGGETGELQLPPVRPAGAQPRTALPPPCIGTGLLGT